MDNALADHCLRHACVILDGGKPFPPFHWIPDLLPAKVESRIAVDFATAQPAMLSTIRY